MNRLPLPAPLRVKSRSLMLLMVLLAIAMTIFVAGWACNSPAAPPQVAQVQDAAPHEQMKNLAAEVDANADDESSAAQVENSTPVDSDTSSSQPGAEKDTSTAPANTAEMFLPDVQHIEGDPAAPVTILEFSDFKCPFCAQFATDTLYWIRENYVKTGKVRFAYKHIATLGPESVQAAEASECAGEQDQFWAYHDRIFANQAARGSQIDDEMLLNIAAGLDLDTAAFEECLSSGRYTGRIQTQVEEARSLEIRATPGFLINNTLLIGAQSYEVFAEIIDQKLAELNGNEASLAQGPAEGVNQIEGLVVFPAEPPPIEVLDGAPQNCGIYEAQVSIDNVINSLAHGAIWIAYHADLPDGQVKTLRELVAQASAQRDEPMIILSPGPYSETPIVATAWRVQLALGDASDLRLKQFIEKFQVGPFTPEPGEPCSGGVGEPVS